MADNPEDHPMTNGDEPQREEPDADADAPMMVVDVVQAQMGQESQVSASLSEGGSVQEPPEPMILDDEDDDDDGDDAEDENVFDFGAPVPLPPLAIADASVEEAGTSSPSIWSVYTPPSFLPRRGSNNIFRNNIMDKPLRVFSIAMLPRPRPELENGGKVILPPSILSVLTQRRVQLDGPMIFRVTNPKNSKATHCGVLEFIAEEGKCYMPSWRMHNIGLQEGDLITVSTAEAVPGTYALFEPQTADFEDITDKTALLENALRNFSCITKGEILVLHYNNRIYELKIVDTKPGDVLNIINCDLNVDFTPPLGSESEGSTSEGQSEPLEFVRGGTEKAPSFIPFSGSGVRLNGKPADPVPPENDSGRSRHAEPDYEWKVGSLYFMRNRFVKASTQNRQAASADGNQGGGAEKKPFVPFGGTGATLGRPT